MDAYLYLLAVAILGLFIGAFLNRCVERLRFEKSIVWPLRAHCEHCYQPLAAWHRIPILGLILSRFRCPTCTVPLSARPIFIALVTAGLIAGLFALHVLAAGKHLPLVMPPTGFYNGERLAALFVYHSILFCFLIVATFIDLDVMLIPDSVTVPGMLIGILLGTFWYVELHPITLWPTTGIATLFPGQHWFGNWNRYVGLASGVVGLSVGGAMIWIVRAVCTWAFRREAMGLGDVTLMAMIGAFLGWQTTIIAFIFAFPSALVIGVLGWIITRRPDLPYGPHLSIGAVLAVFFWQPAWAALGPLTAFGPRFVVLVAVAVVVLLAVVSIALQGFKRITSALLRSSDELVMGRDR